MQRRYPDKMVRVDGLDWRIRDAKGNGPPLLMMPGGLGNADIFYNQMLALAPGIRCILVDYPEADVEAIADGLPKLLDTLGFERASLLGSSLAGYWLQIAGFRYPERIDTLLIANSFCDSVELHQHPLFSVPMLYAIGDDDLKDEWLARLKAREQDELRDVQIALLGQGQSSKCLRQRLLAAAIAAPAPVMQRGMFPLFLLDCADDPLLPAPTRNALSKRYPDAVHLTLPVGGHYPSVTQAAAYNRFICSAIPDCPGLYDTLMGRSSDKNGRE